MAKAEDYAQKLYAAARRVPRGKVIAYGTLGSLLTPPLPGRVVGRLMWNCPADAPWWRVIAASGTLPIYKRSPSAAAEQRSLLEDEGVTVVNGKVDMRRFACDDTDLSRIA